MAKLIDLNGLNEFKSKLENEVILKPSTDGTSGQVLTSDGNGGQTWETIDSGGVDVESATGVSF